MKKILFLVTLGLTGLNSGYADAASQVRETLSLPGGNEVIYVEADESQKSEDGVPTFITKGSPGATKVLLNEHPDADPEKNLSYFHDIQLSPDNNTLYFNTSAWATEDAIHKINISTKEVSYVGPGSLMCVVPTGAYQGDLVVDKHKYTISNGSYNALFIVDPNGKEVGVAAQSDDDSSVASVCPKSSLN